MTKRTESTQAIEEDGFCKQFRFPEGKINEPNKKQKHHAKI
jgi:hypothetical protein